MEIEKIVSIHSQQKEFFASHATLPLSYRTAALRSLKERLVAFEPRLLQAMQADMGKPWFEAATAEIWAVQEELDYTLRHLTGWVRPRRVRTPLLHAPASSAIHPEPFGQVLIISPWNYPYLLLMSPLIGALAAGNVALLKPSEHAPRTAAVIEELVNGSFDPGLAHVINGGVEVARNLLSLPYDYIFFTGGTRVGRLVMKAAAEHLTPVTLELGGKSPVIVDASADLEVAASRIVWGKFFNAGQTCIAPDYVLAHASIRAKLVERMVRKTREYYGEDPSVSPHLARIINGHHFNRLKKLIDPQKVVYGGQAKDHQHYIAPTILDPVSPGDLVMEEEIFGPILPVLEYNSLEEAMRIVQLHPNPLALYLFTRDKRVEELVVSQVSFGGGCINDVVSHFANSDLPFGGRGSSGMGRYHGRHTFETFTHYKSILRRSLKPDVPLRYPPNRISERVMRVIFTIACWLG